MAATVATSQLWQRPHKGCCQSWHSSQHPPGALLAGVSSAPQRRYRPWQRRQRPQGRCQPAMAATVVAASQGVLPAFVTPSAEGDLLPKLREMNSLKGDELPKFIKGNKIPKIANVLHREAKSLRSILTRSIHNPKFYKNALIPI